MGLAFEECLKDLSGGDGVEAFGGVFPRKVGGSKLFPGAKAAQAFILKVDGDSKAPGQAGGKAVDELGLGTLGVVHIQRQPKDDGVNALGCDDIRDFLKQVLLAPDYGKRGCNCLIAVADGQSGALCPIIYSKVSHCCNASWARCFADAQHDNCSNPRYFAPKGQAFGSA